MKKIGKRINHACLSVAMLPTAALSIGLLAPLNVAQAAVAEDPTEIIVTARREKEELQKVPISMTVFTQESLSEKNVTNGADLVAYTPSLNVNQRFGSDQASFAIRGFSQDLRTTASVGVYFADVVAPRGGGSVTSGDGAGPGAFFDLQNVQVLKGPQGTLFGRNTTGGAILLVPQEPTTKLEGYVEVSRGNYDMERYQGVLNLPITDSARARFGIDTLHRDGYINNLSDLGPDRFSDVNYLAGRASLMLDLSDTVRNYTIAQYAHSENSGVLQKLFAVNNDLYLPDTDTIVGPGQGGAPRAFSPLFKPALESQGDGFYDAYNGDHPDPKAELKQWQVINTTTWDIADDLTLKNILGYADLLQTMRGPVFGTNVELAVDSNGTPGHLYYFPAGQAPGVPTNSQTTFSEELQFSGNAFDGKLKWQAGFYYENSRPDGWSGSQSPGLLACESFPTGNPENWSCVDAIGASTGGSYAGNIERQIAKIEYLNQAVYTQGTYAISDEWKFTLGLRYTVDETKGKSKRLYYRFAEIDSVEQAQQGTTYGVPIFVGCSLASASLSNGCLYNVSTKSEKPTGTIGLDYLPTADVMIYTKYSRGYRQGSVVLPAPEGLDTYEPESVDAYELGAKTSFRGVVPGSFNISLFYNELKNQQLQVGFQPLTAPGSATTNVVNGGVSTIQGVELETNLRPLDGLMVSLAYTYLETHLDSLDPPPNPDGWLVVPSIVEGGHLTFSPRHTATLGLNYRLPLPLEAGDVSVGANYSFTSEQISSATSRLGTLPVRQLLNLNMGWKAIFGSPFDASFFVTNALNEEYIAYVSGLYDAAGGEFGVVGEPKMYGARIKYNFGF